MAGMSYAPTANYNGPATLTIVTSDLGNTGAGGPLTDTDTVNITVNAVDDAPVNSVPAAQTTNEDTALVFSPATATWSRSATWTPVRRASRCSSPSPTARSPSRAPPGSR